MAMDSSTKKKKRPFNDLGLFTVFFLARLEVLDSRCSENEPAFLPHLFAGWNKTGESGGYRA